MNKICSRCCKEKPATHEYFYRMSSSADGLGVWCRACVKAYQDAKKAGKGMKMARGRKPKAEGDETSDETNTPQRKGRQVVIEVTLYEDKNWRINRGANDIILYDKRSKDEWYYSSLEGVCLRMLKTDAPENQVDDIKGLMAAVKDYKEFVKGVAKEINQFLKKEVQS